MYLACGMTDMRKGFDTLAAQVQTMLSLDPHNGALYVFRGRRGDLVKILWWDGQGLCLFAKRLERGKFLWPQAKDGSNPGAQHTAQSPAAGNQTSREMGVVTRHGLCLANALAISPRAMPLLVPMPPYAWFKPATFTHPTINPLATSGARGKRHTVAAQIPSPGTAIRCHTSATSFP